MMYNIFDINATEVKTNKKGKEISNIQPSYESIQDLPTKCILQQSDESI